MGVADIPLLSQIKGRMTWLDERQRLIAQNVANSDTPGYVGRDLRAPSDFAAAMNNGGGLRMVQTSSGHMPVGGPNGAPVARFTSEASPEFRDHARRQCGGGRGADAEDGREPHGL